MRHLFLLLGIALVGCSGSSEDSKPNRTPRAVGSLPQAATMAPLHLLVSNQSFDLDPVDIDIYVDDVKLVTGDFLVEGQHSWHAFDFSAEANKSHTVKAITKVGAVEATDVVEVPSNGRWVVVNFWYYGPNHYAPTPASFGIDAYDQAPAFD